MSGEKSFESGNAQIIDMKAIEAQMTPEQLAAYQKAKEGDRKTEVNSETEAANKKQLALEAVKKQEERNRAQEQSDRKFVCDSLVNAMETKNPQMLDALLGQYIKDQTAFKPLRNTADLENMLQTLAFEEPDTVLIDFNKDSKMLMNTAYVEVPFANGEQKQIAITVKADYYYENSDPVVSFQVSEITSNPESTITARNEETVPTSVSDKKTGFFQKIGKFFSGK